MLRICISGLTASGKTTLGEMLAKELNIKHISVTYNTIVKDRTKLASFIKKTDPNWVRNFDNEILKMARSSSCVITARLAPWLLKDATLRVRLNTSLEERARRRAKELHIGIAKAKKMIEEIDAYNAAKAKSIYGIDLNNIEVFDLVLNTEKLSHKECISIIAMLALNREKLKFR